MASAGIYTRQDVERLLGYFFHGGKRWQRPDAPESDMPKAASNPARRGSEMAEMVDITRAWWACVEGFDLLDPVLLWGRYADDLPIGAMATVLRMPETTAEYRIWRDVEQLTTAINEGWRPGRHNIARMWSSRANLLRARLEGSAT